MGYTNKKRYTSNNCITCIAMILSSTAQYNNNHTSAFDIMSQSLGIRRQPVHRRSRLIHNKLHAAATPPMDAYPPPPIHRQHPNAHNNNKQSIRSAIRNMRRGTPIQDVRYSQFLKLVNNKQIDKVTFSSDGTSCVGHLCPPKRKLFSFKKTRQQIHQQQQVRINHLPNDPVLLDTLTRYNVDISVVDTISVKPRNVITAAFRKLLGPLLLFSSLFFLFRTSDDSSRSPLAIAKMKPSFNWHPSTNLTFADVAGCDGAKLELSEVVDFLKEPQSYTNNGCIIPRGVLLYGPPGTGKTLLAKAVAGEAGVPFVSISGSEFVELYVGVGASRVRELFFQAKKNAPCIVFLDEIDAVARQRGAGYAGGNDEREQTINQILVEMDGFSGNSGVITLAATNRVDILDEALLRPGRFDRKVAVELPEVQGRIRILNVHSRGKPLEPDVDLDAIGRRTPGFSGAQLENLMNEAAISAARRDKATIGWEEVDGALDRLIVGIEKRDGTSMLPRKQVELVAYHESGHAICGALIPNYDQVQKISIIPRSNGAGGLTFFSPDEGRLESGLYTKQYLESQLVVALGGRVAEEIIYGEDEITTGASNDLKQVANIAKRMVKEWGMSDKVGALALSEPQQGGPFMGRSMGQRPTQWGGKIMSNVDSEIERLVNNSYLTAKNILMLNRPLLDHLAKTLVEQEVVSAEEFQMMLVEYNAKVIPFEVVGKERSRDKLPFKRFPKTV